MGENSIWDTLLGYLRATLAYWWTLLPGVLMALPELYKWLLPDRAKEFKAPFWLRLSAVIACVLLAQFLAFRDQTRNLQVVIEEKQQLTIRNNSLSDEVKKIKDQLEKIRGIPPEVVTRTLPVPEEPMKCWSFYYPLPREIPNLESGQVILSCNKNIRRPFLISVEFQGEIDFDSSVLDVAGNGNLIFGLRRSNRRVYEAKVDADVPAYAPVRLRARSQRPIQLLSAQLGPG